MTLSDKELLKEYGRRAKAYMKALCENSYSAEKEAKDSMQEAWDEIQTRMNTNNWQPATIRQRRNF